MQPPTKVTTKPSPPNCLRYNALSKIVFSRIHDSKSKKDCSIPIQVLLFKNLKLQNRGFLSLYHSWFLYASSFTRDAFRIMFCMFCITQAPKFSQRPKKRRIAKPQDYLHATVSDHNCCDFITVQRNVPSVVSAFDPTYQVLQRQNCTVL
jgi:hypothetical protein